MSQLGHGVNTLILLYFMKNTDSMIMDSSILDACETTQVKFKKFTQ